MKQLIPGKLYRVKHERLWLFPNLLEDDTALRTVGAFRVVTGTIVMLIGTIPGCNEHVLRFACKDGIGCCWDLYSNGFDEV